MKAIILYSTLSPHCDIATYKEHKTNTNSVFIRHEVVECETLEDALDMATPLSRETVLNTISAAFPLHTEAPPSFDRYAKCVHCGHIYAYHSTENFCPEGLTAWRGQKFTPSAAAAYPH